MRIFVTGGTGFIGRHVVELLGRKQHELLLLVRNKSNIVDIHAGNDKINFVAGDLSDIQEWRGSLESFQPDVLIHLAWEGLPDYSIEMCQRNLKYGEDLFIVAAEIGCECILSTGSCWEYKRANGAVDEEAELELDEAFPSVKNILCRHGEDISDRYGIRFYWPRLFFVYGPGQRRNSLIRHVIDSFQSGIVPEIRNLHNKNDFIYVKDAAAAIVGIVENQPAETVYNIGTGRSVSVAQVISMVRQAMRCDSDISEPRCQVGEDNFWADISRIQDSIGWSPEYSLEDGVGDTVRHYAAYVEVTEKA